MRELCVMLCVVIMNSLERRPDVLRFCIAYDVVDRVEDVSAALLKDRQAGLEVD